METLLDNICKPNEISPLTLAFVGDGVYDLLVREYLVKQANRPVGELNKIKVDFVCCKAQNEALNFITDKLTEQEISIYKRGRNAKVNCIPKNSTRSEYNCATGFETLFGYLYLDGQLERLREIFGMIINEYEKEKNTKFST